MFYQWGYEYVAFADTKLIRDILKPTDSPPESFIRNVIDVPEGTLKFGFWATGVIQLSEDIRCFIVILPTPLKGLDGHAVLLPGLGPRGAQDYLKAMNDRGPERAGHCDFGYGAPHGRLVKKECWGMLQEFWENPQLGRKIEAVV
jgi:hypothetical protein